MKNKIINTVDYNRENVIVEETNTRKCSGCNANLPEKLDRGICPYCQRRS